MILLRYHKIKRKGLLRKIYEITLQPIYASLYITYYLNEIRRLCMKVLRLPKYLLYSITHLSMIRNTLEYVSQTWLYNNMLWLGSKVHLYWDRFIAFIIVKTITNAIRVRWKMFILTSLFLSYFAYFRNNYFVVRKHRYLWVESKLKQLDTMIREMAKEQMK